MAAAFLQLAQESRSLRKESRSLRKFYYGHATDSSRSECDFHNLDNFIKDSHSLPELCLGPVSSLFIWPEEPEIPESGLTRILQTLANKKKIQAPRVAQGPFHKECCLEATKQLLCHNTTLLKLELWSSGLNGLNIAQLEDPLSHNAALKNLTIREQPISDKFVSISRVLAKGQILLETLVLVGKHGTTTFGDNGLFMLANALATHERLRYVDVSCHQAREAGWVAVGQCLRQNRKLEKLEVFGGDAPVATCKGFKGFVNGLVTDRTVKSVARQPQLCSYYWYKNVDVEVSKLLSQIDMLVLCNTDQDFRLKAQFLKEQQMEPLATKDKLELPAEIKRKATKLCDKCQRHGNKDGLYCSSNQNGHFVCIPCLEAALEQGLGHEELACPISHCQCVFSLKSDLYGNVSAFHFEMHCVAKHRRNDEVIQRIANLEHIVQAG